jgi:hypothetical protein
VIKFTQTPLSFARLREIAARVKFEQRRPVTFPFRLTGVPAGWQVRDVQGRVSLSDVGCDVQLDIGPASGLVSALQLSLVQQAPSCKGFDPPPTSGKRVTKYGVTWYYYPASGKDPYAAESISTAGPSAATGGLGIAISVHVPSPYGDAYEVFHRMTLLGTSPANWTTRPLG